MDFCVNRIIMDKVMKEFIGDSEVPFAFGVNLAVSQEQVVLRVTTGEKKYLFALSPQHMKRMMLYLQDNVALYEKTFGELKTDLQRSVPSPIQFQQDEGSNNKKPKK